MFIVSVKPDVKKILFGAVCFCLVVFSIVLLVRGNRIASANAKLKNGFIAENNVERIEFLESFGWKVSKEATEVVEVAIPISFNDVYEKYNKLQKSQGFDLSKYKGKLVSRYTYKVTNYKNEPEFVVANILVYNNQIIAGDICSLKIDGFMHALNKTSI